MAKQCLSDPEVFYQLALDERVAALIYATVRDKGVIPSALEERLGRAYYECAAQNAVLFEELEKVLNHLATLQIKVILLKGAALAETVYGNVAVRPMDDLDLLLRRDDVPIAYRVLKELGYRRANAETRAGAAIAFKSEISLIRAGPPAQVEIHWSLNNSAYVRRWVAMDWFWETAVPVSIGAARAKRLGPEAQLLHLCAHQILNHNSGSILWMQDAALMCRHNNRLDWDQVLSRARQYRLVIPTQQVLLQISASGLADIPESVLQQVRALPVSSAEARLFQWRMAKRRTASLLLLTDMASLAGWRQRARYAWVNLFPTIAYMRQRYRVSNRFLLPLYYPYRWYLGMSRGWFK